MNYAVDRFDRLSNCPSENDKNETSPYDHLRNGDILHSIAGFFVNLADIILDSSTRGAEKSLLASAIGDLAQSLEFSGSKELPLRILTSFCAGSSLRAFLPGNGVRKYLLDNGHEDDRVKRAQFLVEGKFAHSLGSFGAPKPNGGATPPTDSELLLYDVKNLRFPRDLIWRDELEPDPNFMVIGFLILKLCFTSTTGVAPGPLLMESYRLTHELYVYFQDNSNYKRKLVEGFKSHLAYYELLAGLLVDIRSKPINKNIRGVDPNYFKLGRYLTEGKGLEYASKKCRKLGIIGDSHTLSFAWRVVEFPLSNADPNDRSQPYRLVPLVCTGLKAFHLADECRPFFTRTTFDRLMAQWEGFDSEEWVDTIVVVAGEIDIREGIGGEALNRYENVSSISLSPAIASAVAKYVKGLRRVLANITRLRQILVLPVCPHVRRPAKKGRVIGRAARRLMVGEWNNALKTEIESCTEEIHYLDYYEHLLEGTKTAVEEVENVLKKELCCGDGTHMNGGVVELFSESVTSQRINFK